MTSKESFIYYLIILHSYVCYEKNGLRKYEETIIISIGCIMHNKCYTSGLLLLSKVDEIFVSPGQMHRACVQQLK